MGNASRVTKEAAKFRLNFLRSLQAPWPGNPWSPWLITPSNIFFLLFLVFYPVFLVVLSEDVGLLHYNWNKSEIKFLSYHISNQNMIYFINCFWKSLPLGFIDWSSFFMYLQWMTAKKFAEWSKLYSSLCYITFYINWEVSYVWQHAEFPRSHRDKHSK